jgi:hypothetical protein
MNLLFRKIRRVWITYVAWRKWGGMWGRFVLGHAYQGQQMKDPMLTTDPVTGIVDNTPTVSYEWMQQVSYASSAPRVFADREALLSFIKILDEFGGHRGVTTSYMQPPVPPEQAVASILETPTAQLTKIQLSVGLSPDTTVTMHTAPGWDVKKHPDPRDGMNGMNTHSIDDVFCVHIIGMKSHTGDLVHQDIGSIVEALRRYTTDPSKDQLRKLKGNFPLVNEDTRQTVREQKFQAGVQKRAAWIGAGAAIVVTLLAEGIKLLAGNP